ncbi:ADP-ribosylation factor family protein (macronuclear) [Tetrahymena thermophila SB210]|uniref:ADP-ribosylation factor family protein n=1 Tax=Tetrahymena thermophila (strain SB210) TaxID=312017 RepID=Q23BM6_TETTS|nr:ADP-ribosylation factor family protein [Tetrahymena thermophila SB210]EAR94092.2 ADP-ribosylation factor family protein [Tetrahymena thermophila SB210]|eukprot:XP_001014337.2 ADP-ribosylation factor family protein [Tetrahymena thermophila SB210]
MEQPNNQFKTCLTHKKEILFLQINKLKQMVGACSSCVTSLKLSGEDLIQVSDVYDFLDNDNQILNEFPSLQDKQILNTYQLEFTSEDKIILLQELANFFADFKIQMTSLIERQEKSVLQNIEQKFQDKVELLKTYNEVCQKGEFKAQFLNYMTNNQDNGMNLTNFITSLNNNQQNNAQILKDQLEAFQKTKAILNQQLPIQQKLKNFAFRLVEDIGKAFLFDYRSGNNQQQISSIQQTLHDQFEAYSELFQQFAQGQTKQIENNKAILSFIKQDPQLQFMKLQQNIHQYDIELNNNLNANISNNQISIAKQNINKFKESINKQANCYLYELVSKLCQQNQLPLGSVNPQLLQSIKSDFYYAQKALPFNNYKIDLDPQAVSKFQFFSIEDFKEKQKYQMKLQLILDKSIQKQYQFIIGAKVYYQSQKEARLFSQNFELYSTNSTDMTKDITKINGEKILNYEFQFLLKDQVLYLKDMKNQKTQKNCEIDLSQQNFLYIEVSSIKQIIINEFNRG